MERTHVVSVVLVLLLLLVVSIIVYSPSTAHRKAGIIEPSCISSGSDVISEPSFGQLYSNSTSVAPGYLNYIYIATGGGDHSITTNTFSVSLTDNNYLNSSVSIIGHSNSNNANIITNDLDFSTSGIGVDLPITDIQTFSNDSVGSHCLHASFFLSESSFVLIASAGTNEGNPSINGISLNTLTCTPWGDLGVLFSYGFLHSGVYTFSIDYNLWGNSTDSAASVGAVVFEFNDSSSPFRWVSPPNYGSLYSNSVLLNTGYLNYIYVATGGGDYPIYNPSFSVVLSDNSTLSENASIIGYSSSNSGYMSTNDLDYSISGIGVNLPISDVITFHNDSKGSRSLNGNFSLDQKSFVLIATAGTNEGYPDMGGLLGNTSSCTPWGDLGTGFSYSILGPGKYNFSINYKLWGNSTDFASSTGAALFVFNLSSKVYQVKFCEAGLNLTNSPWFLKIGNANYISYTNQITASLLAGQYSFIAGQVPILSPGGIIYGPNNMNGTVKEPSTTVAYSLVFNVTVNSLHNLNMHYSTFLLFGESAIFYVLVSFIVLLGISVIYLDYHRRNRQ